MKDDIMNHPDFSEFIQFLSVYTVVLKCTIRALEEREASTKVSS